MATMTRAEWNRLIDEFLEEDEKLKGMKYVVKDDRTHPHKWPIRNRLVTEDLIRHFGEAMGDPNPLWRDPEYAKFTRWGGIIAPPTFEHAISEGQVKVNNPNKLPGWVDYVGGSKRQYFKPIRPGDYFRIVDKYLGITEKSDPAKPYRLFQLSNERRLINQKDEVAVIIVGWLMATVVYPGDYENGKPKSLFTDRKLRRYTQEELDFIHNAYEEELAGKWRRGADTRYWEDVVESEELHPIIKGTYDITDMISHLAATGMAWEGGHAMKWKLVRDTACPELMDPVTGEYHAPIDMHHLDSIARQCGIPGAFAGGANMEVMIAHLVTNWMGDDAFVRRFEFQHRNILLFGDVSTQKGKVTKKYVKDGEHLVDLDVWNEQQDGITVTVGNATVQLISRED